MASILVLAMCTLGTSVLYSFGEDELKSVDNVNTLENDEYFRNFIEGDVEKKPSLDYLRKLAEAKEALDDNNLLLAMQRYVDMQREYGNYLPILFGIGESYYKLADFSNALTYFNLVIVTEDDGNTGMAKEEILAHYRIADIFYQLENIEVFSDELRYIISQSAQMEDALFSVMKTTSLDSILNLFSTDLDYSYIARRELGVYLSYRDEQVSNEAIVNLITALSMATNSFTRYLVTQEVGYQFADLFYMIELLQRTKPGQELLFSFNIANILVGLRKYYNSIDDAHTDYMADYCTLLLELLGFFETEESDLLYVFYPNLQ